MRSSLLLSVLFITLTLLCGTAGWCADWPSGDANKAILTLPISKIPVTVDGKMAPGEYDDAVVLGGSFMGWGFSPRPQSPTVYLKRSKEKMYVCFDNPLNPGERPSMTGATPDNPGIAMGNALELYFMPRLPDGELLKYIQFLGNARGCISDALTTPKIGITSVAEFNLPWEFKNTIVPGHWYAEISIPFSSLFISKTGDGDFFDMDMGRDGGTGPNGVHSYTMAFHQIQTGAGARVKYLLLARLPHNGSPLGILKITLSPHICACRVMAGVVAIQSTSCSPEKTSIRRQKPVLPSMKNPSRSRCLIMVLSR